VHIAALTGAWIAAVAGFGGMRDFNGELSFTPRLPSALTRLACRLRFQARSLLVEVTAQKTRYSLLDGEQLKIRHHGRAVTVKPGQATTRAIPRLKAGKAPEQPKGRMPQRRQPTG
jgi:alpha,alpha-trehalose phosphorylase